MLHRRRFSAHHTLPSAKGAHSSLWLMCAMMMFWTLSEGIVSFIVPLKIGESGVSDTMMGLILGTSSIAGAVFDLVACRIFKDTYYKRTFSAMFALCVLFPLILLKAREILLFVLGMIIWGIYYDLRNIGNFDYIARTTDKDQNSRSFGMIQVFQSIGWILGPILVGFLINETVDWRPFATIWIFLGLALICFVALCLKTGGQYSSAHKKKEKAYRRGTWSEVRLMGKIGRVILPTLVAIFFLNFLDSFFWSIGPLFAEHINLGKGAGFLMTAWSLPSMITGWFAGSIAKKYGKERTGYFALFAGSLLLIPLFVVAQGPALLFVVFIAATFTSIAWPTTQGTIADHIEKHEGVGKEIEGLEDLYTNLGYVIGPMLAGFLADLIGYNMTFGALGLMGVVVGLALMITLQRKRDKRLSASHA